MPSERYPEFERDPYRNRSGYPDFKPSLSRPDSVQKKFIDAGFASSELPLESEFFAEVASALYPDDDFNKTIGFVGKILTESEVRKKFARGVFLKSSSSNARAIFDEMRELEEASGRNETLEKEFFNFVNALDDANVGDASSEKSYAHFVWMAGKIMTRPSMFAIFGGSGERLSKFEQKYFKDFGFGSLRRYVDDISDMFESNPALAEEFLEGFDESIFLRLPSFDLRLEEIFYGGRDRVLFARKLFQSDGSWKTRLNIFDETLETFGFPLIPQVIFEEKLLKEHAKKEKIPYLPMIENMNPSERYRTVWNLVRNLGDDQQVADYRKKLATEQKREIENFRSNEKAKMQFIHRRESEYNPLVSLGVARTVGYEVEYPNEWLNNKMYEEGLFQLLAIAGFKVGTGGFNSKETSPGPFYDPNTANVVFGKYVDAGIINFYKSEAMTMHFNVGVNNREGLHRLVRAMHLTGAAYDPHLNFERFSLTIRENMNYATGVTYIECKTFDVLERHEFEWNMKSASYLSWALGAFSEKETDSESGRGWKKRLADIWSSYLGTVNQGLGSLGFPTYLDENDNDSEVVGEVRDQLRLIFPDSLSRYKRQRKGGLIILSGSNSSEKIKQVKVGRRFWFNVASFAREVTDEAVSQIETIANEVEKEAAKDVKRITALRGGTKDVAIKDFIRKYNYTALAEKSSESEVFEKVTDLLS